MGTKRQRSRSNGVRNELDALKKAFCETIGPEGPFNNYCDCFVPPDHAGPCALTYCDRRGPHWIILPDREDAIGTAIGACRHDVGGYSSVAVYPVSAAPAGADIFSDGMRWLFPDAYDDEDIQPLAVAEIVRSAMRLLAQRIAAFPNELAAIEWRDLERLLFEVFKELGFDAELTRSGKDGGFDLSVRTGDDLYLVEVKHWSNKRVGMGVVQRVLEVVASHQAKGLIISTSGFSKDVIRSQHTITEASIHLGTQQKVVSLCQHFAQAQSGLWIADTGLREVFFNDLLNKTSA